MWKSLAGIEPRRAGLAGLIAICLIAESKSLAQTPRFEVASIKASNPSLPQPGRLAASPVVTSTGRLTARNARLKELIKGAYALEDYQVSGDPQWRAPARFDVEAKSIANSNREQLLPMLRALLADRFRLAVHRETRELAICAGGLKNGPKFHALTADEGACWPACSGSPGKINHLRQSDLPSLARFLTRLGSDKPVIDKTGLKGHFALDPDISNTLERGGAPPTNESIFRFNKERPCRNWSLC